LGARKIGHRSIVAPLATLAAAAALGVGVALARAGRERTLPEPAPPPEPPRRDFALLPGERLAEGLRRMALAQTDLCIELLGGEADGPAQERAVHETRKALKRLRALLRLLTGELGEKRRRREDRALRDIAGRLAGARDSEVMLTTLQGLAERQPERIGSRRGVRELLAHLHEEHERASRQVLEDAGARAAALEGLRAFGERAQAWELADTDSIGLVEPGLLLIYRQGRRRYARVAEGHGDRTHAMHEWRKRVKDLRYAAEMLQRAGAPECPRPGVSAHGPRPGKGGQSKRLRRLARRADELGELLGEEHDLAVLAELIRARARGRSHGPHVGARTRRLLLGAIARRRRKLRRRALRQGERLYRRRPSQLARRVRQAHLESRPRRARAGSSGVRFPGA